MRLRDVGGTVADDFAFVQARYGFGVPERRLVHRGARLHRMAVAPFDDTDEDASFVDAGAYGRIVLDPVDFAYLGGVFQFEGGGTCRIGVRLSELCVTDCAVHHEISGVEVARSECDACILRGELRAIITDHAGICCLSA